MDLQKREIQSLQDQCWDLMLQDPVEAMVLAEKSLELASLFGLTEFRGRSLFMKGWCHIYAGRYPDAPALFEASISEFMQIQDLSQMARSYNGMGSAFQSLGQFGVAVQHYETSLAILEQIEESTGFFAAKINLVSLHCAEGDWVSAKKLIAELDAYGLDSLSEEYLAEYYYVKAWTMLHDRNDAERNQYIHLADEYAQKLNFNQLLFHIGILKVACSELDNQISDAIIGLQKLHQSTAFDQQGIERYLVLTKLASLYAKQKQISLADETFKLAFELDKNPWVHQFLLDLHQAYGDFLALQGNFSNAYIQSQTALKMQQDLYAKQSASSESNREISKEIARLKREDIAKEVNIRALQLLHQKTQLINNIGQQLASTFDISSIGLKLFDVVKTELDVHFISIAEYVADEAIFKFEIMVDQGNAMPPMTRSINTPGMQATQVVNNRAMVLINDYKPSAESLTTNDGLMPQSGIFLPLYVEGELIAVWSLQSPLKNRFKSDDVKLLEALAPFVAIAFNNALSHRRLKQLNTQIEQEKEIVTRAHKEVEHQAMHDGLTGLPNRRQLVNVVTQRISGGRPCDKRFHLLYIDLNRFKDVNDVHGHKVGDLVLEQMGSRMQEWFRDSDIVARVGGDEFVAILSEFSDKTKLHEFVDKFTQALEMPIPIEKNDFSIGASVGLATFPEDGVNLDQLILVADQNMYRSKATRKLI